MNPASQKTLLRQQLRSERTKLSSEFCQLASAEIIRQLSALESVQNAKHVALYWPTLNECNPLALINILTSKQFYLPVINKQQQLEFYPYRSGENLIANKFNILEPSKANKDSIKPAILDVVLMPLLGFDEKGNRLGMGGGYYDRSLSFRKASAAQHPLLIGLAYEFQKLDQVPVEPWDINLDYIVTEARIYPGKP